MDWGLSFVNISEIIKLIDAGYTKAEIEALEKPNPAGDAEKIEHPEGKEDPAVAVPKSLALLRENLYF